MKEREGGGAPHPIRGKGLRAAAFSGLADPCFVISPTGEILEANRAGMEFLSTLPPLGAQGSVGLEELALLFRRAATRDLAPSPFQVEGPEGGRYLEARFGPADGKGRKSALLADVSVWKRALAEKEALLRVIRGEAERSVAVCARCGALRDAEGRWSPPGASSTGTIPRDRLSHGLCPVCLAEELGHAGLGSSAIAEALAHRTAL